MTRETKKTNIPWIGEIPSDWSTCRVKDIFLIEKEKANQKNPIILSLARDAIKERDISTNEGQLAASYEEYNPVIPGDLLLNPMDLYSGANCNVSEVSGVISPAYSKLRKKVDLNPFFFDYFFKVQYWTMAMFAHGRGVSFDNRWTLNNDTLKAYECPFPSVEEQNKIVKEIKSKEEKINALITNEEKQIEKLKEYKQTLISEVVTKGLDPNVPMKESGTKLANKIPANWRISRLKYEVTCNDDSLGENCSPNAALKYVDIGSVDFYDGITEVKNVLFEDAPSRARRITKKGDVIVSTVRTYLKAVATINENGLIVSTGFAVLRSRGQIADQFLSYYCRSNLFTSYVYLHSNGINYPAINASALICAPVFLPPSEEQLYISDFLNTKCSLIDKLINKGFAKIAVLRKYRQSLIYEYVTGKREVS